MQKITHKYELALESFNKYYLAEKKLHKNNELSTVIVEILLEEVTSIEFKIKEKEQQIAIKKREEAKLKNKAMSFKFYFKQLQENVFNEDYEQALSSCLNAEKYTNESTKKYYYHITNLLKTIIEMNKNHCGLKPESMIYPDIKDYNFLLDLALKNKDYQTAYKNIGKCLYFNPTSNILKIYRSLLSTVNNLNKKYSKKVSTVLTDEYLLKLIREKKYSDLKVILSKNLNGAKESFYLDLLKLINFIDNVSKGMVTYNNISYNYQDENIINNFYEALNIGDYRWALKIVDICAKDGDSKFIIYKAILKDVVNIMNKYQDQNDQQLKVKEADLKIDCLLDDIINNRFSLNYLLDLQFALNNKEKVVKLSEAEDSLLHLIETYLNLNGTNFDFENYFSPIKKNGSIIDSFNKALKFGDYKTALDLMNCDEWFSQKIDNSKYYSVIRKILVNLKIKATNKNQSNNNEDNSSLFNNTKYLDLLANLKKLIKKREYLEAKKLLEENNLSMFYEVMVNYLVSLQKYENECEAESFKR